MVDASGAVVWEATYLPFGKARVLTAGVENNLRFPGQYFDEETGLHYNWNRYYDPENGRYVTADPIGLEGGVNLYAYVQNDPVNFIDHEGLSPVGFVVKLTAEGVKKVGKLTSKGAAQKARRQGQNVLAKNKQMARQIEKGAHGGQGLMKHKGHDLPNDRKGLPHYQTDGRYGHTFWSISGLAALLGTLSDPFDAIAGELNNPEEVDTDGNGVPDYLEYSAAPCN